LSKTIEPEVHFEQHGHRDSNPSWLCWRLVTWIQICTSLNHCKKKKAEPIQLIPRKLTANVELLIGGPTNN